MNEYCLHCLLNSDKTTRHESTSRLRSFALAHSKLLPNSPGSPMRETEKGKVYGQHLWTGRHESITKRQPTERLRPQTQYAPGNAKTGNSFRVLLIVVVISLSRSNSFSTNYAPTTHVLGMLVLLRMQIKKTWLHAHFEVSQHTFSANG